LSLVLRGVRFGRANGFRLDVENLSAEAGRTTVLLGANGAGKTTLLRVIAGLERAEGEILFCGAPPRPTDLALCFQEPVFLDATVHENLDLALRIREVPADERTRRLAGAARECGVEHLLSRRAAALSAGERQRANVARALALRAPLTLLDEPLAALDAETRERLLGTLPDLLRSFARVAVVVTHDAREALTLADDLVVLHEGGVIAAGAKADLCARPSNAETARLLGLLVLDGDGARYAVPPGSLTLDGPGAVGFDLVVERVVDLGIGVEVTGRIGAQFVAVRCEGGAPRPGATTRLHAVHAIPLP
jgi:ABC-type sugar transport system ATPase subunit